MSTAKNFETLTEIERIKYAYQVYHEADFANKLWSAENPGNQRIVKERTLELQTLLTQAQLLPLIYFKILDIGCGNGDVLATFLNWGALPQNLFGIDLLENRINSAKQRHPSFHFTQGNAECIPYPDLYFNFVIFFTVFSSILDPRMRMNIAKEADRILKPGGRIIWYDFRYRNPKNHYTQPMGRKQIAELFPSYQVELKPITLLPPLARRLGKTTNVFYPFLSSFSFLRTHYIGFLIKPGNK
ncbi:MULTISPECIES: class I SAM-dependent methyltransferase [Caldilinea]|uniref:class I SAM-dependent methyltransferase n=1 Tax=Caldilinea TaxID=233191 RepID=UPI000693EC3B|nr:MULTISPECIES: class I SAM-dependent methyltransferase [Caldilinea]GIV75271.1 MAG: hypothetical protein KatS3mg049_3827 [Caldilinea sp.]